MWTYLHIDKDRIKNGKLLHYWGRDIIFFVEISKWNSDIYIDVFVICFQNSLYQSLIRPPLNFLILIQKKKYSNNNIPTDNEIHFSNSTNSSNMLGETFHFSIPSPTLVPLRTRTHVKGPRDRAEIINVARSKNHTPYPSSTREGGGERRLH